MPFEFDSAAEASRSEKLKENEASKCTGFSISNLVGTDDRLEFSKSSFSQALSRSSISQVHLRTVLTQT